jgi:hypothetical protein
LFVELKSHKQSEHVAPLLTALGKGVPAKTQKERWGATDRGIRKARENSSIQKITPAVSHVSQETINIKKPRGPGSAHQRNSNEYLIQASSTFLLLKETITCTLKSPGKHEITTPTVSVPAQDKSINQQRQQSQYINSASCDESEFDDFHTSK